MHEATSVDSQPGGDSLPTAQVNAFDTITIAGIDVSASTVSGLIHDGELVLDVLSARERDTVLQLCEIARRRADAAVTQVVDSADRTRSYGADGHASVRGWGKSLTRWSNHDASTQKLLAQLVRDHSHTAEEYLSGRLGRAQAVLLAKLATHPRAGSFYPDSEALLVEDAQKLDYEDFKTVANRWLTLADMDGADQEEKLKHYLRSGCVIRDNDGMVHLEGRFAGRRAR